MSFNRASGSFRDPSGNVFIGDGRVLRVVNHSHVATFDSVWQNPLIASLMDRGVIVSSNRISRESVNPSFIGSVFDRCVFLEHKPIELITYPYEWSFEVLRSAALAHLDLHMELLEHGLTLSDASAYNMQPISEIGKACHFQHIDLLSIVPYEENSLWVGYDQFLREFFNLLVIEAATGFSLNNHYRGGMNGLTSADAERLLPIRWCLKPTIFANIVLPARVERRMRKQSLQYQEQMLRSAPILPKSRLMALLTHLRFTLSTLTPPSIEGAHWLDYSLSNEYTLEAEELKKAVVADWASRTRPSTLLDIGCNIGTMSIIAIENGVGQSVGIDTDRSCLDRLWCQASMSKYPIIPLLIDWANQSPNQGWQGNERNSSLCRLKADGLLALALIHHLIIKRNLPINEVIESLINAAPLGLIEFVPKNDPMIGVMLAARQDSTPNYNIENIRDIINKSATIVSETNITDSGRCIIEYRRI